MMHSLFSFFWLFSGCFDIHNFLLFVLLCKAEMAAVFIAIHFVFHREALFHWFWVWVIQLPWIWHCKPFQWVCRIWLWLQPVRFLSGCILMEHLIIMFLPSTSIYLFAAFRYPDKDVQYHFFRNYLADRPSEVCKFNTLSSLETKLTEKYP